ERHRLIPSAGPLTLFVFVESKPGPSRAWSRIQTLDALSRSARLSENRISPARGRHHDRGCPTLLAFFSERVGIGDSTARVIATLRNHHDRGCPTLLASFARGWGLGIPPPELSQRCGTITTKGAPSFSRLLREGGDWGFHRTTYSDAAGPSRPRVPHPSRVFARGWGLGIPPPELSRRCGTITTKSAPPFSRLLREGGDWGF